LKDLAALIYNWLAMARTLRKWLGCVQEWY
jgi:hypothetical protein